MGIENLTVTIAGLSTGTAYTDEQVRDVIAAALVAGSNVTITPNDAADTITISATGGGGGTNIVVQEGDTTVVSTVSTLDFGNGLDVTESPTGEANIVVDLTEYTGGALPLARGGTGATTAADARTALELGALATKNTAAVADLAATGTPSNSTFLRGDGSWAAPPAGGGGGDMLAANNLADVANAATALANLGGQPLDSDLTAIAELSTTPYGRGLLTLANLAALATGTASSSTYLRGDGTWATPAGGSSMTASEILAALLTVDGTGSGLDADLLDGQSAAAFEAAGTAAAAITAHEGAADPHPGYTTSAELTAAISAHEGAADPHPGYTTSAELTAALAAYQPLDSDLTSIAALSTTVFGRSLLALADAGAARAALGLVIGTDVAAQSHVAATSGAHGISTFGASLVDDADAAAARTTLGLGALATKAAVSTPADITATGTASNTTFLRGDGAWATPPSGSDTLLQAFPVTLARAMSSDTAAPPAQSTTVPAAYLRVPWAFTLTEVRAFALASDGTAAIIDVHLGPSGSNTTVLGNRITIDANERSSTDAGVLPTIVNSTIPEEGELWFYFDQISAGWRGVVVYLLGTRVLSTGVLPTQVTGLAVSPGNAQNSLTWNPVSGATSYVVDFSTNSGSTWTTITGITLASYTHTGLTNGTAYLYRVRAVNQSGAGTNSGNVSSTPRTVPGAPTLTLTATAAAQVTLTITAPASNGGATISGYTVLARTPAGSGTYSETNIVGSAAGEVVVTQRSPGNNLLPNTQYEFVAVATNIAGTSANSTSVTTTTTSGGPVPNGPTLILSANGFLTDGAETFTLDPIDAAATSFQIRYRRNLTEDPWSAPLAVTPAQAASGYSFSQSLDQATYAFQARASNGNGSSAWSDDNQYDNANSDALAAPASPAGSPDGGQVVLTWSAVAGATAYGIDWRTATSGVGSTWVNLTRSVTGTTFTHSSPTGGLTNRYRIFAINASAEGGFTTSSINVVVP